MSLFGAMTASVSGLAAQGQAISVISDNLANTNTLGYKASRALFSQLVTSSGVSGTQYNAGGLSTAVRRDQGTQGSLTASNSVTDLAISGNGFFRVSDSAELSTNTTYYYTRAGAFTENKEGYLVTPAGYFLQGWRTDSDGNIDNLQNLVNIGLQSVGVSAQATRDISMGINLNSTILPMTDLYDTTGSLNASLQAVLNSTSENIYLSDVRVYDSQGTARDMTIAFSKRANNMWDWQLYTDGSNIQGGTAGVETVVDQGILQFNPSGTLKYATRTDPVTGEMLNDTVVTANWAGGVNPSTINFNFGEFSGGKISEATVGGGLEFGDHVYSITVENESMPNGTYTLRYNDTTSEFELLDGTSTVMATLPASDIVGAHELVFDNPATNTKVRIALSAGFDETPAPVLPATTVDIGTFSVRGESARGEGLANNGVIQYASSFNTSYINQNGFASGNLSAIQIDENGFVSGTFTNGETKKLYKVALAVFQNPRGLEAVSGSLLRTTDLSGQALIKEAGNGGTGRIVSGALEGSTTDIANEFSQMIVSQRAFQASSTVITTVDQMLQNLLQIR